VLDQILTNTNDLCIRNEREGHRSTRMGHVFPWHLLDGGGGLEAGAPEGWVPGATSVPLTHTGARRRPPEGPPAAAPTAAAAFCVTDGPDGPERPRWNSGRGASTLGTHGAKPVPLYPMDPPYSPL